jgi:hypothetical protein
MSKSSGLKIALTVAVVGLLLNLVTEYNKKKSTAD